jgi:hypothetical protein
MHRTRIVSYLVFALALLFLPKRAEALINVGAEGGLVKRSADSPNNLKLGLGYGAHGEVDLLPLIKFGPYYMHYELSSADSPAFGSADAVFNTLGLRARLMLPIPGSYKPYAFAGVGYSWVSYTFTFVGQLDPGFADNHVTGHFFETPLGAGIAYEVIEIFQLSLDAAYRPAFGFGGNAFGSVTQPTSGWSLMLGAALNF